MKQVEFPKVGLEDEQVEEFVHFMVQYNQLLAYPLILIEGWLSGKIRIFTSRDDKGTINGMEIYCMFVCPVTARQHAILSFCAGESLSDFSLPIIESLEVE